MILSTIVHNSCYLVHSVDDFPVPSSPAVLIYLQDGTDVVHLSNHVELVISEKVISNESWFVRYSRTPWVGEVPLDLKVIFG